MRLSTLGTVVASLLLGLVVVQLIERQGWLIGQFTTVDTMFAIVMGMILLVALGSSGRHSAPADRCRVRQHNRSRTYR